MALKIKLDVQATETCSNLVIKDITGSYDITNNPGGWGGVNLTAAIPPESISIFITVYHYISNVQYTTTIQIPESAYYTSYPFSESVNGFKMSIPADVISTAIANQITLEPSVELPEEYEVVQEALEDNIYEVVIRVVHDNIVVISEPTIFKSTCNMRRDVELLLTSIDTSCHDCDNSDFDRALLAKSLLEGLENN